MVSRDYYFVGFPVMWNMVAFYVYYIYQLPPIGNFLAIIFFAIIHFVPIKFLYPSRTVKFRKMNILVTILFIVCNMALIVLIEGEWQQPQLAMLMRVMSVLTMIHFGLTAVYHTYFDEETKNM